MDLNGKIKEDIKKAMKEKDNFKRDTLRLLSSAIKQVEVDERKSLNNIDIEKILAKMIKQRKESISQYKIAKREDLIKIEENEINILDEYLPQKLTENELQSICKKVIDEKKATIKDMGLVIKSVKETVGGSCDGKSISEMVKKILK